MAPSGLAAASVLAHQGGWDEILMVLTPIALFAALLWLANSRATRLQQSARTPSGSAEPTDTPPSDDAPSDDEEDPRLDPDPAGPTEGSVPQEGSRPPDP